MRIGALYEDLDAETAGLEAMVAGLDEHGLARPTPAPSWTIKHQIAHLSWTDAAAYQAAAEPERFTEWLGTITPDVVDTAAERGAAEPDAQLLATWRDNRERLRAALLAHDPERKLPWFGPPMRASSMVTARLMETWAHGQDIADTVGVRRQPSARLRHVAHIAIRARPFAYHVHGRTPPEQQPRVELTAPDGSLWTWGAEDAADRVTGPAQDFCLLATRRRHRADLAVRAAGSGADEWLDIVQAFAGPPGPGREPGQFR